MSEIKLNLNHEKTIEFILQQLYFSEWQSIDGLNQHPKGLNFYDWLWEKELITIDEYAIINEQLGFDDE